MHNTLKISVYKNAITWTYVDGFSAVTRGHVNVHTEEDKAAYIGDIVNEIQEANGTVSLEVDSLGRDLAI